MKEKCDVVETRIHFLGARRMTKDVLAFRVDVLRDGETFTGNVHVEHPEIALPNLPGFGFTEEMLPFNRELGCAAAVALAGRLRSAHQLRVGEEMETDAEAIVSEDPPPAPGMTAVRVLWMNDEEGHGAVVVFKSQ